MRIDISPESWQALGLMVLMALMLVALVFDIKQRRIPNTVVLFSLGAGLLLNGVGPPAWLPGSSMFSLSPGALGLKGAVLGALAGLAVFLPFYALRAMGAGDVKLMAGIGAFVGPAAALNIALFILVAGGLLAVLRMVWKRQSRLVLRNVATALGQFMPGSAGTFDPATQSADSMPYAVAIAGGLLAYAAWIFSGHGPLINF